MTTKDAKANAILKLVTAVYSSIKEMGDHGAPLGPMYAATMSVLTHDQFMEIISILKEAKMIEVKNHVAYSIKK